jgi:hypothetical protein
MKNKPSDLPRSLPLVTPPSNDELLSSWLTRIAQDYYIPTRRLLTHMGISSPSPERLDLVLTISQAITMGGYVRQPPDAIIAMTHTKLPADCQRLVRLKLPQQTCRTCAPRLKRDGAAGAVLKGWMQGWRITCRSCGSLLQDVWKDNVSQGQTPFAQFEAEARMGEALVEHYAAGTQSFPISPATMLRLLLLRKFINPAELWDEPRLPRRLIGTIISSFDAIADEHGLNTGIGKTPVLPVIIRVGLLAGLAAVMKNPLEQLPRLRAAKVSRLQFDAVLAQDPIINPGPLPKRHFT